MGLFFSLITGGILAWEYFEPSQKAIKQPEEKPEEEIVYWKSYDKLPKVLNFLYHLNPERVISCAKSVAIGDVHQDGKEDVARGYDGKNVVAIFESQ